VQSVKAEAEFLRGYALRNRIPLFDPPLSQESNRGHSPIQSRKLCLLTL
jgi:hypothetical protein